MEESKAVESPSQKEIVKSEQSSRRKTLEPIDENKSENIDKVKNIEGRKIIKIKRQIEPKNEENKEASESKERTSEEILNSQPPVPEDESTIEASKVPEKKKPSFVLTSKLEPFAPVFQPLAAADGAEQPKFKFDFKLESKTFGF